MPFPTPEQQKEIDRAWRYVEQICAERKIPWAMLVANPDPLKLNGMQMTLCDINFYRTGRP